MSHVAYDITLNTDERIALLASVPAFAHVPEQVLEHLAKAMLEEQFVRGEAVVTEGETGDRLYLIVRGRAEVSTMRSDGAATLATLEPGELFGEIALLSPNGVRSATVTALSSLLVLSLDDAAFTAVLNNRPELRAALSLIAENLLTAKFLKRATPFTALEGQRLRSLAERLRRKTAAPGEIIVHEGERGDACYLVRSGCVEVVTEAGNEHERQLTVLGPGMLFGEAALLTDAPRNATIRAIDACELLVLERADLLQLMGSSRGIGSRMFDLLRTRTRPRRSDGIVAQSSGTPDGDTITVLKDPLSGTCLRLSEQGRFVWDLLDGEHGVRDLQLGASARFGSVPPAFVRDLLDELEMAGFIQSRPLREDVPQTNQSITQRVASSLRAFFSRRHE